MASDYAGIANYWKFYDGETKQLIKYKIFDKKQQDEKVFQQWAAGKPEFQNIFSDWSKAYDAWKPYVKQRIYLSEGILGSPLAAFAASLAQTERVLTNTGVKPEDAKKRLLTLMLTERHSSPRKQGFR